MKLQVYGTESYNTFICKEPVEVDTDNYPELEGMTEDEIKEYIESSAYEMKAMNPEYENLEDELQDKDILRDRVKNETFSVIFEGR